MQRIPRCKSKNYVALVAVSLMLGVILLSNSQVWAHACLDVTKFCRDSVEPGGEIEFWGTVTNCGDGGLHDLEVTDNGELLLFKAWFLKGESVSYSGTYVPSECPSTNVVTARALNWLDEAVEDTGSATCDCPDGGGDGCTPGYWKNHLDQWTATVYTPGDDFDATFGVDLFDPDITLEQAVNMGGGQVKKVARHGTAALISADHPSVNYPLSVAEVIAAVKSGNVDALVTANELGCPIN